MGIMWAEGFHSPQTTVMEIAPYHVVFLSHPKDSEENGWGYPFVGEDGEEITTLGTAGGTGQVKAIIKREEDWVKSNTPGNQVYGNIDWRGPVMETREDGTEIRMNLTWNGPRMRYFPDDDYDYSIDKAKEVYYRGKYVAYTPFPVLGCAARQEDISEAGEEEELVWMLYVLCKNSVDDVLYKYRLNQAGWDQAGMTDAVRNELLSPYSVINPNGYEQVFYLPRQSLHQDNNGAAVDEEAKAARTPWFFNESCTKAVCMREVTSTYIDPNDVEYEEDSVSKYVIDISTVSGSAGFEYAGNLAKIDWVENHVYKKWLHTNQQSHLWTSVFCEWPLDLANSDVACAGDNIANHPDAPCEPGCSDMETRHVYVRFHVDQLMYSKGAQILATDFDGDIQVTARVEVSAVRNHKQEFLWGVDCDPYYSNPLTNLATYNLDYNIKDCSGSICSNNGMPACNNAPGIPPYFGNGDGSPWTGGTANYTLKFKNSSGKHEFTLLWDFYGTEYQKDNDGVQRDDDDVFLEYHGYKKRFIHFLDLRHPFVASFTELNADEYVNWDNTTSLRMGKPLGTVARTLYQKEGYVVDTNEATYVTNTIVLSENVVGHVLGYDWIGNMPIGKIDVGGPDWPFSEDITYDNPTSGDYLYKFTTEYVNSGWQEGLDERSTDKAAIEPAYEDWYQGILGVNKWPSMYTFFNNTHYDDILGKEVHLNNVDGGFAKNGEDWILSYIRPADANLDGSVLSYESVNYINGEEAVPLVADDLAHTLHPLGVF